MNLSWFRSRSTSEDCKKPRARGGIGYNWLFFGEQHAAADVFENVKVAPGEVVQLHGGLNAES